MTDIKLLDVSFVDWPNRVLSAALSAPPVSPSLGDAYIIASSPTGAWSGHVNDVARWDGSAWAFQTPTAGRQAWNNAGSARLQWNGSAWVALAISLQGAYNGGNTIAVTGGTDIDVANASDVVLHVGSTAKLKALDHPTANTTGYATTITGSKGGAAAVSGTPGDGGTITIQAGTMGSETLSPGSVAGGVAGNNLILRGGDAGNTSGLKAGSVVIDAGQLGTGAAGGTPVPGDVKIGQNANQTHVVRIGQSTSGTPVEVKGPVWTPLTTLTDAATVTVTIAKGNAFKVVLGGNRTLDFSFPTSYSNSAIDITGHVGQLVVQQDGSGSRTLGFASKVKTAGDVTLNSAASAYTVFEFYVESLTIVHLRKVEASSASGGVTSFNSRTGAVTPQTGDYTATNVGLGSVTNDAQLKRAAGDIASFTVKSTPVTGDLLLIEDSASANAKKSATIGSMATALAINNVTNDAQLKRAAGDIASFTTKATPVSGDLLLIEDSAAANAKKSATVGSLATALAINNVTNDAQLKRSAGDFATFTHKTTPTSTDVLIIEDAAAAGAKKFCTIAEAIAGVSSGVTSFNTRTGAVTPQTGDYTATNVGLGSVTNDAQLTRAAGDFATFTVKGSPIGADLVLIEDSAASNAKKKATLSSLAAAIGVSGGGAVLASYTLSANAATLDTSTANDFTPTNTMGGNTTLTLSNGSDGGQGTIYVKQDGTGGRTLTFTVAARTIIRDANSSDDNPESGANTLTAYSYHYVTIAATAYIRITKVFLG